MRSKDRQVAVVHVRYKAVKAIFAKGRSKELKATDRVFALKETYREQPVSIGFLRLHSTSGWNKIASLLGLGHLGGVGAEIRIYKIFATRISRCGSTVEQFRRRYDRRQQSDTDNLG